MSFDDIRKKVAIAGIRNKEQPLELTYVRDGETSKVQVLGSLSHADPQARHNFQTIGVRSTSITEVGQTATFGKLQDFEKRKLSDLKPGDKILGVDGVLLDANEGISDFLDINSTNCFIPSSTGKWS